MLLRLILGLIVFWAIFKLIKLFTNATGKNSDNTGRPELMLKCDYCGTHVPANEAIRMGDKIYCSSRHLDLDQAG